MSAEHDGRADPKFLGLQVGVVTDNKDPEKIGRVRVRIPGLIDEASAWAFPLGWPGSGGKQRGTFAPPPIDAEVGVFFHQGDVDHPYYLCGHPGRGETPSEVQETATTPEQATKVFVHETDRWRFTIDSRDGKEQFQIRDKKTDDVVEIDGVKMGVRIKATSTFLVECDGLIKLDSPMIQFGDRVLIQNGKAIK